MENKVVVAGFGLLLLALLGGVACVAHAQDPSATLAKAEEYRPLDSIIDFKRLDRTFYSLRDPTTRANVASFDAFTQTYNSIGGELEQHRGRHVVRAVRFVKIPDDMTAGDVIRAWREAGGNPDIRPPAGNSIFWSAQDVGHSVSDMYIGTGFECAKPGQPGVPHAEIWARRFLFVTEPVSSPCRAACRSRLATRSSAGSGCLALPAGIRTKLAPRRASTRSPPR